MAVLSEVQYAVISQTGTTTIVAAVTGAKIRVIALALVNTAAQSLTFKSGAGGTALTGAMALGANGQIVLAFSPTGHFETAAGAVLELAQSGATQVSGVLGYVLVT